MPRKKKESHKCPQCGETFAWAMHLGRHLATKHGQKPATARPRKARKARAAGRRAGRPSALVARLGLPGMSLEQLIQVITAAKAEAAERIAALEELMR